MSKVNIKSILENKNTKEIINYNIKGILNNNKLSYIENDTLVNIDFSNDNIIMKRILKDKTEMLFDFKLNEVTICIYKIYNRNLKLNIFTNNIKKENNYVEIDYDIEEEKLNFKLFIE
jgi:hypothetical protein